MDRRGFHFDRRTTAKVERTMGLCAVYCVGPKEGVPLRLGANEPGYPVKFGLSYKPDEIVRQARTWSWASADLLAVAWCRSESDATAVKQQVDRICGTSPVSGITGSWHDMTADVALLTIQMAANAAGVSIFDEAKRAELLRQEVLRVTKRMDRD